MTFKAFKESQLGCAAQPMALEVTAGKTLPDTTEETVKSANTPRDHGQGVFFFKLFRCPTALHVSALFLRMCLRCLALSPISIHQLYRSALHLEQHSEFATGKQACA